MTYKANEAAHSDPIELFRFSYGGYFWRYTNADEDVEASDGETYFTEPVLRSAIGVTQEADTNNLTVTLAADNPVAEFFTRTGMPMRHVWLTVYRTHRDQADKPASIFVGVASDASFMDDVAQITFVPLREAMGREVPYRLVGRLCSNSLYDSRCLADPASFSNAVTITAVNGLTLTVSGAVGGFDARPVGYFSGGFIYSGGLYQYATIREHVDTSTVILLHNPGFTVGLEVVAYAGCDKRLVTCHEKFANVEHFQGFPFFPIVDPFKDGVA